MLSRYLNIIICLAVIIQPACNKFVQIDPPTSAIAGATVYSNNGSAAAAMTGVYDNMIANTGLSSGNVSIGWYMGLAADELKNYDPTNNNQVQFYSNSLSSVTNAISNYYFWNELYNEIYAANAVLEGISKSTTISAAIRTQLTGEAKFMRAFLHFYATNLYGDVPLVTTTNYLANNSITRTPQAQVYQQIIADLKDAQSKLSAGFVDALGNSSKQRGRPNQGAATALLARAYLYMGNWDSAEAEASAVINNSSLYSLDSLNAVFLANSTEAIWQLQPNSPGYNTFDANFYVLQSAPGPGQNSVAINTYLANAFESGDARPINWVGAYTADSITYYYYPYKYKVWQQDPTLPVTEYTMVLRLAEQYLIRAEARSQKGNIAGAQVDLNIIRSRAWLSGTPANDQRSLLNAILHERQVELFTEWGHRWFDLKRTGNLNSVMGMPGNVCQSKGGNWNSDWALLPIALQELKINPHLVQNPGYN